MNGKKVDIREERADVGLISELVNSLDIRGVAVMRYDHIEELDTRQGVLLVTTTLCPLYLPGELQNSCLISYPQTLEDSRVAGKWYTGLNSYLAIAEVMERRHTRIHLAFTFADKGVISFQPMPEDAERLRYHEEVYKARCEEDLSPLGITWTFQRYSDIMPLFPEFSGKCSDRKDDLNAAIDAIVNFLQDEVTWSHSILNQDSGRLNRKGKKIIRSLINTVGNDLTTMFLHQYGIFDAITSRNGALNVYFERGELLLNLTNLFAHRQYPRLDILCE